MSCASIYADCLRAPLRRVCLSVIHFPEPLFKVNSHSPFHLLSNERCPSPSFPLWPSLDSLPSQALHTEFLPRSIITFLLQRDTACSGKWDLECAYSVLSVQVGLVHMGKKKKRKDDPSCQTTANSFIFVLFWSCTYELNKKKLIRFK